MFALYAEKIRRIDSSAKRKYGISPIQLMENAGAAVANAAVSSYSFNSPLVVCGPGNNGGDGFVAARHLFNRHYDVKVFIIDSSKYSPESLKNLNTLKKMSVPIFNSPASLKKLMGESDIIIDAVFGSSFRGNLKEPYSRIIKSINSSGKKVVSIDIPSGMDGSSGRISSDAVRADITVVLGVMKTGLLWNSSIEMTGDVYLADISIPEDAVLAESPFIVPDTDFIREMVRHSHGHKTDEWTYKTKKGILGIVGGSKGMQGAPQLSGISALKTSSGMVYAFIMSEMKKAVYPEIIISDNIEKMTAKSTAVLIGPGMGTGDESKRVLIDSLKLTEGMKSVLDADALNIISGMDEKEKKKSLRGRIITPHPEEFRRLSGSTFSDIREKIESARSFAKRYECLLVLKSPPTIITDSKVTLIFPNMSKKLATAGSGDVLAGIIGSLLSSGLDHFSAAAAGVHIHFKAGDDLKGYSASAGEIANNISKFTDEVLE